MSEKNENEAIRLFILNIEKLTAYELDAWKQMQHDRID
jgi:hypothetical protein